MEGIRLNTKAGKLIYFGDPMCSWCWGIANNVQKLRNHFSKTLDFELVMGGLRPGGGDPWNKEMKSFLREHWDHVKTASGQSFGYKLFEKEEFDYDTEPPSRAVVVVRNYKPEVEYDFFKAVQERFYVENEDPGQIDFYKPLCEQFGIPFNIFLTLFESEEFSEKVQEDFAKSRKFGIRGFPSVVFQNAEKAVMITNGFATFETMNERVDNLIRE